MRPLGVSMVMGAPPMPGVGGLLGGREAVHFFREFSIWMAEADGSAA